jgi:TolB-like protein
MSNGRVARAHSSAQLPRGGYGVSTDVPESSEKEPPRNPAAAAASAPAGTADATHTRGDSHAHHTAAHFWLLEQLKHRNIIRVAILYLVLCWLILEPLHVLFHMLDVPVWANRLVVLLMAVGFPLALVFAWVYEITPEGLKLTAEVDPRQSIRTLTGQRLNRAITLVMAAALVYFAVDKFWLSKRAKTAPPVAVAAPATVPVAPAISDKSVAVLAFVDMSEKKDQEYFPDELSEELIDLLTKIPDVHVPARTSSFYFKGKSEDIPTIAKRLMVAHVLEGSVRKSGDHLRVTAQLVRADNGYHLWSETYDRRLDDVFKMQDDIAAAVVKALKVSLLGAGTARAAPTSNSEAYTLYLQAMSLAKRDTSEDSLRAHDYLKQARGLDPRFALAWAALAELYPNDSVAWGKIFPPDESACTNADLAAIEFALASDKVAKAAHDAAARALTLAPDVAEVHSAMARVLWWFDFDWDAADAELQKARALDPGNARIAEQLARLAVTTGRHTEAVELAKLAATLDPLGTLDWELGTAYHRLGSLDQAAAAYRHLIELHPTKAGAHYRYGLVLMSEHNPQAALEQFEHDEPWYREAGIPLALDALGRHGDADAALATVEQHWTTGMAYQISYVYAGRGDTDRALSWLERAYRQHDAGLLYLLNDPMLVSLQGAPRFKAIVRKLKLPEVRTH